VQINKLFNREKISECTRLERYVVEWWRNKSKSEKLSDETAPKKRVSTVSKQNIVAKYIRNDNEVFLCIPSIRLDGDTNTMNLSVYVDGEQVYSEEMKTKRGELASYIEIYNEKVNDLLEKGKTGLKLREVEGNVIICDLKEEVVHTPEKVKIFYVDFH